MLYNIFARKSLLGSMLVALGASFCAFISLNAGLLVSESPVAIIQGAGTALNQPEGVTFSPSDDHLVIANSLGNTISIYRRIGDSGALYDTVPSFIINDKDNLDYPHDVKFTPDGRFLGAVSRWNNRVLLYKRKSGNGSSFGKKPSWRLKKSSSMLSHPASLAFSPKGDVLGVCNRQGSITLYKIKSLKKGEYNKTPYQEITQEQLLNYGISNPHGIAFSPDGNAIATVHKKYFINPVPGGESALVIFEKKAGSTFEFKPEPSFISYAGATGLHSIAYHPSGKYLAVTDGMAEVNIYQKTDDSNEFTLIHTIGIKGEHPGDEGPKGVAFSNSGNLLAVTVVSPYSVHLYDLQITEE